MTELRSHIEISLKLEGTEQESLAQASMALGEYRAAFERFAASRTQPDR